MSWDKREEIKRCKCACGCGYVEQLVTIAEDDWNRKQHICGEIHIKCNKCSAQYHIEKIRKHRSSPSWVGWGDYIQVYLVPNGKKIPDKIEYKPDYFYYKSVDEEIVAKHTLDEIKLALEDMEYSKYSTRLQLDSSYSILHIYKHKHKKVGLKPIIKILRSIVYNYNNYKWNTESIKEYKEKEEKLVEDRNNDIQNVLTYCYLLDI